MSASREPSLSASAVTDTVANLAGELAPQPSPGPWLVFNMVHAERGDQMTPEEMGEYVAGCIRKSVEDGGTADRFLFVTNEVGAPDICHVGNGPRGPANARLIAAAPELLEALKKIAAMDKHSGASLRDRAASEIARAAITKATGEA